MAPNERERREDDFWWMKEKEKSEAAEVSEGTGNLNIDDVLSTAVERASQQSGLSLSVYQEKSSVVDNAYDEPSPLQRILAVSPTQSLSQREMTRALLLGQSTDSLGSISQLDHKADVLLAKCDALLQSYEDGTGAVRDASVGGRLRNSYESELTLPSTDPSEVEASASEPMPEPLPASEPEPVPEAEPKASSSAASVPHPAAGHEHERDQSSPQYLVDLDTAEIDALLRDSQDSLASLSGVLARGGRAGAGTHRYAEPGAADSSHVLMVQKGTSEESRKYASGTGVVKQHKGKDNGKEEEEADEEEDRYPILSALASGRAVVRDFTARPPSASAPVSEKEDVLYLSSSSEMLGAMRGYRGQQTTGGGDESYFMNDDGGDTEEEGEEVEEVSGAGIAVAAAAERPLSPPPSTSTIGADAPALFRQVSLQAGEAEIDMGAGLDVGLGVGVGVDFSSFPTGSPLTRQLSIQNDDEGVGDEKVHELSATQDQEEEEEADICPIDKNNENNSNNHSYNNSGSGGGSGGIEAGFSFVHHTTRPPGTDVSPTVMTVTSTSPSSLPMPLSPSRHTVGIDEQPEKEAEKVPCSPP